MDEKTRAQYEKWLEENNVPRYMRLLYNDDPVKIRDALRAQEEKKQQEATARRNEELRKAREEEAARAQELAAERAAQRSAMARENAAREQALAAQKKNDARASADVKPSAQTGGLFDVTPEAGAGDRSTGRNGGSGSSAAGSTGNGGFEGDYDDYYGDGNDDEDRPYVEEEDEEQEYITFAPNLYGDKKEANGAGASAANKGAGRKSSGNDKKASGKKKSGKAARVAGLVAIAVAAILIALIIGNSIIKNSDFGSYKLGYMTIGEVTEQGAGTAFFARSSDALFSPADGIFMAKIPEGDRVEAGGTVGYIVKEENKGVLARLKQVNATILALQGMSDGSENVETEKAIADINAKIETLRQKLSVAGGEGNLAAVGDSINEINRLIEERDRIIVDAAAETDSIVALRREKEELENIIDQKMVPVVSQKAGVVSYSISDSDNVENELFSGIVAADGSAKLSSLSLLDNAGVTSRLNSNVATGEKLCKIIENQEYYLILRLQKKPVDSAKIITVVSDDMVYQASGTVTDQDYGTDYVIVSTMRGLKSSLALKNVPVTFDVSRSTGLCVPMSALSDWDKNHLTARIALVKAGYVQFVYVGVKAYDDEKAIISATPFASAELVYLSGETADNEGEGKITAGDCYIVDAKNVRNGQQIA
ncbi:MAG: hypothetical protein II739_00245 [Clostridia bacterium]|nr:hypothetical protein [Clostridia bacterium]